MQSRENVLRAGSAERIGSISGAQLVEGRLRVASTSARLDALTGDKPFQILAILRTARRDDGDVRRVPPAGEDFDVGVGGHGEALYSFTATRAREEMGG